MSKLPFDDEPKQLPVVRKGKALSRVARDVHYQCGTLRTPYDQLKTDRPWTVSELNVTIRDLLENELPNVWVEGEISNARVWNTVTWTSRSRTARRRSKR